MAPPAEEEVDEQVVGVLAWCEACGEKTVHVGGVCRDHKVVRRRRRPGGAAALIANPVAAVQSVVEERRAGIAAEAASDRARVREKQKKKAKRRGKVRYVVSLIVVAGLVVTAGFFHVVHGSTISIHVCAKHGWSLADTLVDLDDYRPGTALDASKVGRALVECQL